MEKILFVDDEMNLLTSLKRQFRKQYKVSTALGGEEGLNVIEEEGPFAVIVADMQMPEMDGIEFLKRVQNVAPDSVRLMLTGNADQKTAIDAVNEGKIFRFLNKPCPPEQFTKTLDAAIAQHQLITAEKELLEGTLTGAIQLLTEVLSVVAPEDFSQSLTLQETALAMADAMNVKDTWNLEFAALFSNIAYVTVPVSTREKLRNNRSLTPAEEEVVRELPNVGAKLVSNIPRLEEVGKIIRYQQKNYDGSGFPIDTVCGDDIPLESRMLRVLIDVTKLKKEGLSESEAMYEISTKSGVYDPIAIEAATAMFGNEQRQTPIEDISSRPSFLHGLQIGDVITTNIQTTDGTLLYSAGNRITPAVLELLFSHHKIVPIMEPIHIAVYPNSAEMTLKEEMEEA